MSGTADVLRWSYGGGHGDDDRGVATGHGVVVTRR